MKAGLSWRQLLLGSGLLLLPFVLAGCDEEAHGLRFSHYLHVQENEMACDDCHGEPSAEGFSEVGHETCVDCHDEVEADEVSRETCGLCHLEEDPGRLEGMVYPPARMPSRAFVHSEVMEGSCADCHGAVLAEGVERVPRMNRDDVVEMREQLHAQGMACDTCHIGMDPNVAPPSHDRDWERRHGFFGVQDDAACGACHAEDSCRACHSVTMPASHNNLWRLKTHGIEAAWDRERCLVCHEPDSCTACHEQVRPRSHNAAWSRTHCYQCHTSTAAGQGCVVCHQDGLIEAHPNPHTAGWRSRHCDSCHPGSPEAEQCQVCHPGGFGAHPNPHAAGWRSRHCDSCHPGSPESDECRLCHETTVETHPNPHSGGWRDRHCFSCHPGSSAAEECGVCHEGGGSVLVHEDFWPPVHNRFGDAADCYLCHTP